MQAWLHKSAMSATVTVVVLGAMAVEGLVLTGPGRHSPPPPAAAGGPSAPASSTAAAGRPHRTARPRGRVTISPQPGNGAHLVAETSPSPPRPAPARTGPPAPARPSSPAPAPQPSPPASSTPAPRPSASTTPPAPGSSPACIIDLAGIRVCLPGQGQ